MIKTPIKRQTLSSWIEKQDSMLSTKKKKKIQQHMLNIKKSNKM